MTEQSLFADITPTPRKYKSKYVVGRSGNIEPRIEPIDPRPTKEERKILDRLENEFDQACWRWEPERFINLAQWFYEKAMQLHDDYEEAINDD